MSKITRKTAKIFGSSAGSNQIAKFGSLAASSPVLYSGATADPANIQALGNWLTGWFAGVEGASSPAIEDQNAFCYVMAYQAAYLMQEGIAEYDTATTYFIGSLVNDGAGNIYKSLIDNNLNNALSNGSDWLCIVSAATSVVSSSTNTGTNFTGSMATISPLTLSYTSTGRDIQIALLGDNTNFANITGAPTNSAGSTLTFEYQFLIDATPYGKGTYQWRPGLTPTATPAVQIPLGGFQTIAKGVAAGAHTISFQAQLTDGTSASAFGTVLYAKEI